MTAQLLLRSRAIRALEASHAAQLSGESLMARAAAAAAQSAVDMCAGGGRVLILAGPGNNGGDAWVVARLLQSMWYRVTVLSLWQPKASEAIAARNEFEAAGGSVGAVWPAARPDLIIDGLLGIGLSRAPDAELANWIDQANSSGCPILALDVPSGLNADTGTVAGRCIRASRTVTFIASKPGLQMGAGLDHSGEVEVALLGVDFGALPGWDDEDQGLLLSRDACPIPIRPRRSDTHKGRFGTVGVVGGARGMVGAGLLAARAALFAGAGKVFFGPLDDSLGAVDWTQPEIMIRRPRDLFADELLSVAVIGPGLGTADAARGVLEACLKLPFPIVLDADALNLIARGRALQTALKRRADSGFDSILTPHPTEAARLLGIETAAISLDRIAAARAIAERFAALVVLKGAGSVIAGPGESWSINQTGNPGMATGGMGDVLAGLLGGLMAQRIETGLSVAESVRLAVWLHGAAADDCAERGMGPVGLTASEVALNCRAVFNQRCLRSAPD